MVEFISNTINSVAYTITIYDRIAEKLAVQIFISDFGARRGVGIGNTTWYSLLSYKMKVLPQFTNSKRYF